jgi:hypothetical protein
LVKQQGVTIMKKLRYTYLNYGLIYFGREIEKLTIELKHTKNSESIKITIDAGNVKIEDKSYEVINIASIFERIEKIELPEQTHYDYGGCDGFAWKLDIDGKKYDGYIFKPDFLKEILAIINFNDIYSYAETKFKKYIGF